MWCMFHSQIGEVWSEIRAELKEEFRPVTADERALEIISVLSEDNGKTVVALQNKVLASQHDRKIQEEKKIYKEVRQRCI